MGKGVSIAIFDSDTDYIESFSEYMKERHCEEYHIEFFTDITALDRHCQTDRPDLIVIAQYLISEYVFEGDITRDSGEHIVVLVDDDQISSINGVEVVYRYQPIDLLIHDILNLCADMSISTARADEYVRKRSAKIVSIYSPIGRCGKTRLAIRLGMELTDRGLKVLLVNLEEFSLLMKYISMGGRDNLYGTGRANDRERTNGAGRINGADEGLEKHVFTGSSGDLSDLLYFYMSGNAALNIKAEAIIRNVNGLDYIPPAGCIRDLRRTDTDTLMKLIGSLGDIRGYDLILLDLSSMIEDVFRALEMSDSIIMPFISGDISELKVDRFKEYMDIADYDIRFSDIYDIDMHDRHNDMGNDGVEYFNEQKVISIVDELEKKVRGD